jgi:hypothetical protein
MTIDGSYDGVFPSVCPVRPHCIVRVISLARPYNFSVMILSPKFWVRCSSLADTCWPLTSRSWESGISDLRMEQGTRGRRTYLHDHVYKSRLALFRGGYT